MKRLFTITLIVLWALAPIGPLPLGPLATEAGAGLLSSKSVYVMDAATGKPLLAKNPGLKLAPASTVKLVTAMVVLDRLKLDRVVKVSRRAARMPRSRVGLRRGDRVAVLGLLQAALMKSANDAAFALAEAVAGSERKFVILMNKKLRAIGAKDTVVVNSTGLPGKGQHTTTRDLAVVMRHALRYEALKTIIGTKNITVKTRRGRKLRVENSNRLLWMNSYKLGGKTGYTRKAKHSLVFFVSNGQATIIVAMLGAKSRKSLWLEAAYIMELGFDVVKRRLFTYTYGYMG